MRERKRDLINKIVKLKKRKNSNRQKILLKKSLNRKNRKDHKYLRKRIERTHGNN